MMRLARWYKINHKKIMPSHKITIAGILWIFCIDKELFDNSWMKELLSSNPPNISPIERKVTLQPREPINLLPDLIWVKVSISVEIESKSLLFESGLINNKIKNNTPKDNLIERLSNEGGVIFGRLYWLEFLELLFIFFIFERSGKLLLVNWLICFSFFEALSAS